MTEQTNEEKGSHLLGLFFKEYDGRKIRKQPVNFKEITTIDRLNLNIITLHKVYGTQNISKSIKVNLELN